MVAGDGSVVIAQVGPSLVTGAAIALGGAAAGAASVRCARRCFGVSLHPAPAIAWCVVIGAALVLRTGSSAYLAPMLAFGWTGVVISGIDLRTHLIPTRLLRATSAGAIALLCGAAAIEGGLAGLGATAVAVATGGAVGWGLMHVIWLASRGSLGYGDVRLGGYLGLHLGLGGLTTVLTGFLAGFAFAALVGAFGIVALGRSTDHRFALGPSLVAGALAIVWWSAPIQLNAFPV
ncbi:hypothetical protein [Candidatus Poriferisodalis sp.]|uniref:hypothetical protein n=1 Tax=Candidatus Poriferisodalis sp. TaxID=3101277 RepID=UPI003B021820